MANGAFRSFGHCPHAFQQNKSGDMDEECQKKVWSLINKKI